MATWGRAGWPDRHEQRGAQPGVPTRLAEPAVHREHWTQLPSKL